MINGFKCNESGAYSQFSFSTSFGGKYLPITTLTAIKLTSPRWIFMLNLLRSSCGFHLNILIRIYFKISYNEYERQVFYCTMFMVFKFNDIYVCRMIFPVLCVATKKQENLHWKLVVWHKDLKLLSQEYASSTALNTFSKSRIIWGTTKIHTLGPSLRNITNTCEP